jgi:flagellar protein FliO/FliZ
MSARGRKARAMLLGLGLAGMAFAAEEGRIIFPGQSEAASAAVQGGGGSFLLIGAVALAAAGAWWLWRARRATGRSGDSHALAIEETRALGNRQYLVVASYRDQKFLLAVCPGRIERLASLHEEPPAA